MHTLKQGLFINAKRSDNNNALVMKRGAMRGRVGP